MASVRRYSYQSSAGEKEKAGSRSIGVGSTSHDIRSTKESKMQGGDERVKKESRSGSWGKASGVVDRVIAVIAFASVRPRNHM